MGVGEKGGFLGEGRLEKYKRRGKEGYCLWKEVLGLFSLLGVVLTGYHTYVPFEFFQTDYSICSDVYTYWAACFTSTYTHRILIPLFPVVIASAP